jgi:hypothetical protein
VASHFLQTWRSSFESFVAGNRHEISHVHEVLARKLATRCSTQVRGCRKRSCTDNFRIQVWAPHFLAIVCGQNEPCIINYIPGATGQSSSRKFCSVWNGISNWETTPSVVKILGEDYNDIGSTQANPADTKLRPVVAPGRSPLGSSKRRAGREVELKI